MKVGDLVARKHNGVLGIVAEVDERKTFLYDETLYYIHWNDDCHSKGNHWENELEVLNASR
jgi:hypothetical protein